MLRVCQQLAPTVQNVESRVFYCQLRRLQIYHCVQLNALFCCLWRNVEASCHKRFVVFFRKTPPLSTSDVSQLAVCWPCSTGDSVDNTWLVAALTAVIKPDIGSESRFLPIPPAFDAPVRGVPVGISPPRLVWKNQNGVAYQTVKEFRPYVYWF